MFIKTKAISDKRNRRLRHVLYGFLTTFALVLCAWTSFPPRKVQLAGSYTPLSRCNHTVLSDRSKFDGKFVDDVDAKLLAIIASLNEQLNPVLVDVGANIGLFTRLLCQSFPNARIHSFEPGSEMMEWLKREVSNSCSLCSEPSY